MAKEACSERRICKDGIEVVLKIREDSLDFSMTIGPEADISKKYVCESFVLKFRTPNNSKRVAEPVRLERRNIKYNKGSASNNLKMHFNSAEYKCEISLVPWFYVSEKKMAKAEKTRISRYSKKSKKNKGKKISTSKTYSQRLGTFKPTPYTKTNIARPYSGGRCTPK